MKLRFFAIIALMLCVLAVRPCSAADDNDAARARKLSLDLAGAFSNDGFKMRDGHWVGTIKPGERTLLAVNLYAGNQYWFCAGVSDKSRKAAVEVYDEAGHQLPAENFADEGKAGAGFSPAASGQYFVAIVLPDGEPATCALMYSYK